MLPLLMTVALAVAPPLSPVSPRLLTITAEAKVTFPANEAFGNLVVTVKERDEARTRKAADEKLHKVLAAMKAAGASGPILVVRDSAIVPDYRGNEIIGYLSTRVITFTLGDLARIDGVLTAALRAGAQPSGAVVVRHSDSRAVEEKARLAAATAARVRATAILEALGGKLGLPRVVSEQLQAGLGQMSAVFYANTDGVVISGFAAIELSAVAQVSVQYDIRDDG